MILKGKKMPVELVLDARAVIGESALWVAPENALYWADIKGHALHRTTVGSWTTESWDLSADIGAFALDGNGRALLALRTGLHWLNLASGELTLQTTAPYDPAIMRFNEGACDSVGRFWLGTMTDPVDGGQSDTRGLLYSFTSSEGLVARADSCMLFNGMAWNADETSFYLAHSYERRIFSFAYDKNAGTLGPRTEFVRVDEGQGIPDGAAFDVEGGYWCAIHGAGRLHRYTSTGRLDRVISLPVSQPTMCCFAGHDLADLYVTSARENLNVTQLEREPHAGGLYRLTPGVAGQPKYWRVR